MISLADQCDAKVTAMRARAADLFRWYANPPTASEMLDLLDAVEHQLYCARSSGHT